MSISIFELFTIGIGPSSSHTVGPMRAAKLFGESLVDLNQISKITITLYGSLALTGKGHGSDKALILGLLGETPEGVDPDSVSKIIDDVTNNQKLVVLGKKEINFSTKEHIIFQRKETLPLHPNGMRFTATDHKGNIILEKIYYSVGGGFVIGGNKTSIDSDETKLPYPFSSGEEILTICKAQNISISELVYENEKAWRSEEEISSNIEAIWQAMQQCIERGYKSEGILPGGLKVKRRAPKIYRELSTKPKSFSEDPLHILDWVNLYALAVNEENAAGGRVVTAPTNGAAGIIPAVASYYMNFRSGTTEGLKKFFLTAGAIGILYKQNASISGAEVGCQGEVGVACSMAAGGLTEALGGDPRQVENAAEIGMEHNLGLTCDPIGGLVQVPCIERNAMGSVKAINATRLALQGDGEHFVSLDKVIKTMRLTGADMKKKYKETSRGGLAVNVIEC